MAHLLPCPGCARHVRASDAKCPFCETELEGGPARRLPTARLGRAATFAFGAAVATMTASGCAESTTPGDAGGGASDAGIAADAGGETDAGGATDASTAPDATIAPPDAGPPDAGTDAGGVAPPYGAPAYGAPPAE